MSAIIDLSLDGTLLSLLEDVADDAYFVHPTVNAVETLIDVYSENDVMATVNVLATDETLKTVTADFLVASRAADLIANDRMQLRTSDIEPGNELVVTNDRVTALISAGDARAALSTDDEGFVVRAGAFYADRWDRADDFKLRTPPLSVIRETLESDISPAARDDFDAILASLETARGGGDGLDEVTISLLVAARNQELLYDISKWGEDIGIASKATFSRTKTMLEDLGLIDTEKVPIDVGRPRLRLKFADERLRNANATELASVALNLMV